LSKIAKSPEESQVFLTKFVLSQNCSPIDYQVLHLCIRLQ